MPFFSNHTPEGMEKYDQEHGIKNMSLLETLAKAFARGTPDVLPSDVSPTDTPDNKNIFDQISNAYATQKAMGNIGNVPSSGAMKSRAPAGVSSPSSVPSSSKIMPDAMDASVPSLPPQGGDNEMEQALSYQKDMLQNANMGKIASSLGASIAGLGANAVLKPNTEIYDGLSELGNNEVKGISTKRSSEKGLMELKDDRILNDPGSDASKLVRSAIQKRFPNIKIPEGFSASQIMKLNPAFKSIADKEMSEYQRIVLDLQKQRLAQGDVRENRLSDTLDWKKVQQDELTPKQTEEIKGYDDTLGQLDKIKELKPAFDTGPISARLTEFQKNMGADDAARTAFKARIGRALATYIKNQSGLTVSDKERLFLTANTLDEKLTDASFMEVLKQFRDDVESSKSRSLETYKRSGRNVDSMAPKNSGLNQERVRIRDPKGNIRLIPKNQTKQAIDAGGELVE